MVSTFCLLPRRFFTESLAVTGDEGGPVLFRRPPCDRGSRPPILCPRKLAQVDSISKCGIVGQLPVDALSLSHCRIALDQHCARSHTTHSQHIGQKFLHRDPPCATTPAKPVPNTPVLCHVHDLFSWASCSPGNADPGSVNCSCLGPRDAVVGVFFHRSPRDNFAVVGSQLSRHRNSFLALGQRTRPKFPVFTFFLHPHYKIANSIEKIDLMPMMTARFNRE